MTYAIFYYVSSNRELSMSTLGERLSVVSNLNHELHSQLDECKSYDDLEKLRETSKYKQVVVVTKDNAVRGLA